MAEWLYEDGIGEARAVRIETGEIVEAAIETEGTLTVGSVVEGRLAAGGVVVLPDGREILCEPVPEASEGARARVEIVREAIAEPGKVKRARGRPTYAACGPGPDLRARIEAAGITVRAVGAHGPDEFEAAGWSELIEAARSGEVRFDGGALRITLAPAMTLIDVDGGGAVEALAHAGADAAARAVRRFGIGGSIGIDLPTISGRAARQRIGAAIDAVLPQPFERTAVNGFGFVQIVRPRPRASLCEQMRDDVSGQAARALLRRAERSGIIGASVLVAAPAVAAAIAAKPEWTARLAAHLGGAVSLRCDPALAISSGYAARS